jgi:hypothetical protein
VGAVTTVLPEKVLEALKKEARLKGELWRSSSARPCSSGSASPTPRGVLVGKCFPLFQEL